MRGVASGGTTGTSVTPREGTPVTLGPGQVSYTPWTGKYEFPILKGGFALDPDIRRELPASVAPDDAVADVIGIPQGHAGRQSRASPGIVAVAADAVFRGRAGDADKSRATEPDDAGDGGRAVLLRVDHRRLAVVRAAAADARVADCHHHRGRNRANEVEEQPLMPGGFGALLLPFIFHISILLFNAAFSDATACAAVSAFCAARRSSR